MRPTCCWIIFLWHDRIPTDAVRGLTITTGIYNAHVWYKITYKANKNDYHTLADSRLSTNRYTFKIDVGSLKLLSGEYVIDIRYEYGTVPAGFKMILLTTRMQGDRIKVNGTTPPVHGSQKYIESHPTPSRHCRRRGC